VEQFIGALRRFGLGRLAALLGVGAGVAAALVAVTLNLGAQPKALLYSNLDLKEASSITAALDQAGVKYEAKGDGSTIMVDRDKVATTRLLLSGKGLPTSASVGYEIFDTSNSLGQTDFVQQLNRQRAVEGELARTIHALDGVSFVRVHLVLPKRQLFEEQAEQPTASVTIGVGGRIPSADMVQAVQNLVAGAVPNLKAERVTIIDQHGKTLSAGGDGSLASKVADDRKSEVEGRIGNEVKAMIEGIVGPGKVRVDVNADIDMNQVTVQEEKYDPDGQVVVSEQTTGENEKQSQTDTAQGVTAANNLPGAPPNANGPQSATDRNASTTNYANSKSVRTEVQAPGQIKKLSVAVAVDGITGPPTKDGKPGPYTARSAAEMEQINALVKAAVGFDQSRGDKVEVVNVPFPHDNDLEGVTASNPLMGFDKNDIMRAVELGVLGIVALLILMFAVRPVMRGIMGGPTPMPLLAGGHLGASHTRTVMGPDGQPLQVTVDAVTGETLALPAPELDNRIDIARIEGQVKASSIKRVSEFVERHPEESVSILRSWLHEQA
jgi:flagellar M-ring protein FliF